MLLVLAAVVGMAAKDFLGTFLVIAETARRPVLAGALDAGGDIVSMGIGIIASAAFIQHGLASAAVVCGATAATSFVSTGLATKLSRRWLPDRG